MKFGHPYLTARLSHSEAGRRIKILLMYKDKTKIQSQSYNHQLPCVAIDKTTLTVATKSEIVVTAVSISILG